MATEYIDSTPAGTSLNRSVFGTSRAGQFLKDAINGTNSVDVVIFGDSNAGSDTSYGYTGGWMDALAALGIKPYGTPLILPNAEASNARAGGLMGRFVYSTWSGNTYGGGATPYSTGDLYSLGNRVAASTASAIFSSNVMGGYYIRCSTATGSTTSTVTLDANASALDDEYNGKFLNMGTQQYTILDYVGSTKTATIPTQGSAPTPAAYTITKGGLRPMGFRWEGSHVVTGEVFSSWASGPSIRLNPINALAGGNGTAGQQLQYRVVRICQGSGGQYKLRAMTGTNTTVEASASFVSTAAGTGTLPHTVSYTTDSLNFTTTASSGVPLETRLAFDGYNVGASGAITGPLTVLWHSVIARNTKGYAVHCLNYYGGATTEVLANQVDGSDKIIEAHLQELRYRQIAAGGTGRVLWFHNSGINGPDTPTSWVTGVQRIVDKVSEIWARCGFPPSDLAFVLTASHGVVNGDPGAGTWWELCSQVNDAAKAWVTTTSYRDRVTFCDLTAIISPAQLKSRNLYQLFNNNIFAAHLRAPVGIGIPTNTCSSTYGASAAGGALWGTGGSCGAGTVNVGYTYSAANGPIGEYTPDVSVFNNGYLSMVLNMVNALMNAA